MARSHSLEHRLKISKSRMGQNNSMHLSEPNQKEYKRLMMTRTWKHTIRPLVLERDKYMCVECATPGKCILCGHVALDVDHIIPYSQRPDLVFELSNLQTLCKTHHNMKTIKERDARKVRVEQSRNIQLPEPIKDFPAEVNHDKG